MSYVITEVFREIVAKVSADLLPTLQQHQESITGVHYQHGSIAEIEETMRQLDSGGPATAFKKYPCVMLEEDITIDRRNTNYDGIVRLRLIIAHHTKPDLKSAAREDYSFSTVLRPIYEALIEEISWHKAFVVGHSDAIEHVTHDRKSWGRPVQDNTNERNRFKDRIDAIEITDLTLIVDHDY